MRLLLLCALVLLSTIVRPAMAIESRCFEGLPWGTTCVEGRFLDFWDRLGGLAQFGYPLGPAHTEQTPDGMFLVQQFERQRFELHLKNRPPYDVLLGRLGDELLRRSGRDWAQFPRDPSDRASYPSSGAGCQRFDATGFTVCEPFISAWRANGLELDGQPGLSDGERLALWGLPLSPPLWETNASGDRVVTQWFERARFEDHGPRGVLFGRLGSEHERERERPTGTLVRGERLWIYDAGALQPWTARGINYNPPWAPWGLWERWDVARVDQDLARIAALNANVLRVPLPWRSFRRSAPQSDLVRDRFGEFVALAGAHKLRVIPILLDEYCKYGKPDGMECWESWPWTEETAELLAALPATYRSNPTIALWELTNEPGWVAPHQWSWEEPYRTRRLDWLRQAAATVRQAAPFQPLTVGVSVPREARDVIEAGVSETITLHYYPDIHAGRAPLAEELRELSSIRLPVLLGEVGVSSSPQLGGDEAQQARFLCATMADAASHDAGLLWWHLQAWHDSGWESELGLYRADASPKPVAEVFAGWRPC